MLMKISGLISYLDYYEQCCSKHGAQLAPLYVYLEVRELNHENQKCGLRLFWLLRM